MKNSKHIVSCGLGVDSTALLILLKQINKIPDLVIFADTGGEKPTTYHFKEIIAKWLIENDFPELTTVKATRTCKDHKVFTLEQECLDKGGLPSIAYGIKQCSMNWKKEPCDKYVKEKFKGEALTYLISFNADEIRRVRTDAAANIIYRYPLIEHHWDRLRCLEEIAKSGFPFPTKSSCFFCPSSKKKDIKLLAQKYPDLFKRASVIEAAAKNKEKERLVNNPELKSKFTVKGLGRRFSWTEFIDADRQQLKLDLDDSHLVDMNACGCIESGVNIEQYWRQFD